MNFDIRHLWRENDNDGREKLIIPVHSELDRERLQSKVQPLTTAAAEKVGQFR